MRAHLHEQTNSSEQTNLVNDNSVETAVEDMEIDQTEDHIDQSNVVTESQNLIVDTSSKDCKISMVENDPFQLLLTWFSMIFMLFYALSYLGKMQVTLQVLRNKVKRLEWEKEMNFQKILHLRKELSACNCKKALHSTLLTNDRETKFFTGLEKRALFDSLHDYIAPFVQRRWKGVRRVVNRVRRNIIQSGQRRGPNRKLRLGLLLHDLARRFKVSETLSSQVFTCWLRVMAKVLSATIHMPSQEVINVTSPDRFKRLWGVHSIIDCSELFIETPQDHDLQAVTWSTYKHHNTLKFLIGVAPNSSIVYISKAYTGRISDKEITIDTGYLDNVPPYSIIMCDKGFGISEECDARRITLYVPPGKRGMSQMGHVEVAKTNRIAKLRILVEQVIRRLKSFRIISGELPISMIPHIDDILVICGALSNMKNPIFVD